MNDTTKPTIWNVSLNSTVLLGNTSVEISANVTDNVNVSLIWASITKPNGNENVTLTLMNGLYNGTFANTSYQGIYNVTVYANDTAGNINNSNVSFTVASCLTNSDCGTDGYMGSNYCYLNDIYRKYRTYTCSNGGTATASCGYSDNDRLIEDCGDSVVIVGPDYCFNNSVVRDVFTTIKGCNPVTVSCYSQFGGQATDVVEVCGEGYICVDGSCVLTGGTTTTTSTTITTTTTSTSTTTSTTITTTTMTTTTSITITTSTTITLPGTTTTLVTTTTMERPPRKRHHMTLNVSGRCVDQPVLIETFGGGKPLQGVDVDVYFQDKKIGHLRTNKSGTTQFIPTEEGMYIIKADKSRYHSEKDKIDISLCLPEITTTTSTTTTMEITTIPITTSTSTTTTTTTLETTTTTTIAVTTTTLKSEEVSPQPGFNWLGLLLLTLILILGILIFRLMRKKKGKTSLEMV